MLTLAKVSIKRPKSALVVWGVVALVLTLIGLGVSHSLSPSVTVVPGTQSSRAQQLANAQFGPTQLVPILLEGPKAQLDRTGPRLVTVLSKRPHTRVLSAWDAGTASASLRPNPTAAMIVVSVDRPEKDVVAYDQPQIESLVHSYTRGGINAYVTGQPSIDRALKDASISNLRQTELIAVGILFLLLLIGLRAPVAALLVTAVGAVSMLAGFGEVALLGKVLTLDPVGVALGTMTGLALGVGFALLILDRFHREEWPDGVHARDVATAATAELQTTGRAVLVGGTALIVALAIVAVIGPTELMVSLGTGALTCAAFATGGAVVVMPAALVLLGRRIEFLRFPAPAFLERVWSRLLDSGNWVTRHAVSTGFLATAVLAAIAFPAFALNSGPPTITQLPAGSQARIAFQEVSRVMGPGWPTPYNLIVVNRNGAVTTPAFLAAINHLQTQIARNKRVDSVTGPGTINATAEQLKTFGPSLVHSAKISNQSKKDLLTLINGLGQAGSGSAQLKSGLEQALGGATALNGGAGQALAGAQKVHSGSAQITAGSALLSTNLNKLSGGLGQLSTGLNQALAGAQALKAGASQALDGASQLSAGLGTANTKVGQSVVALKGLSSLTTATTASISKAKSSTGAAASAVDQAKAALASMGPDAKKDPHYGAAVAAADSASTAVGAATSDITAAAGSAGQANALAAAVVQQAPALVQGVAQLAAGAGQLEAGISKLRGGNAQLANGIGQLAGGGKQASSGAQQLAAGGQKLTSVLGQLTNGAGQLEGGLGQLASGTGQLAFGLAAAPNGAGQLQTGLGLMQAGVVKARGQIPSTKALETLLKESPGMFSSGYFVLSAVAGARGSTRTQATFAVNLYRGGTAGQIVVTSKYASTDPRTSALATQLDSAAATFAKQHNAEVAIGGPAGSLGDLTSVTKSRIWLDVAVLAAAIVLVLGIALRAVVLPVVATAFSLLVAAATFGILELLFGGSNPPLGGPGYMDPMSIIGIFTVVFGITVVFSALLLMRTREAYVAGPGSRSAVRTALRQTAAAATGAGLVMVAAVIPFAHTDLINVRQFGVGVCVAILLEVLIVRPVLLPAAEAVLGRFGWWPTRGPLAAGPAGPEARTRVTRHRVKHMPLAHPPRP